MDVKEPFQMYAVISGSKSLRSIIDLHVAGGGRNFSILTMLVQVHLRITRFQIWPFIMTEVSEVCKVFFMRNLRADLNSSRQWRCNIVQCTSAPVWCATLVAVGHAADDLSFYIHSVNHYIVDFFYRENDNV